MNLDLLSKSKLTPLQDLGLKIVEIDDQGD